MKSLTYYIIATVLKLKGIKKTFSEDPIDYLKLRKDDIHSPTKKDILGLDFQSFMIKKSQITEVVPKGEPSENTIFYCHGGATISGPSDLHWNSLAHIVKQTNMKAFLVDYPKAPEHQITEINENIDAVYEHILSKYSSKNIILLGDSAGAMLLILLVQRLVKKNLPLPKSLILISPVLDVSMTNPAIEIIDKVDIMLSRKGVISAKTMCAGNVSLQSEEISPIYGSFKNFIPTYLFTATHDIMYPDSEIFIQKLRAENIPIHVFEGKGMPHIWAFLPVMSEAKKALNQIVDILNKI
jgi:acetyl esterase/lipase